MDLRNKQFIRLKTKKNNKNDTQTEKKLSKKVEKERTRVWEIDLSKMRKRGVLTSSSKSKKAAANPPGILRASTPVTTRENVRRCAWIAAFVHSGLLFEHSTFIHNWIWVDRTNQINLITLSSGHLTKKRLKYMKRKKN